MCCFSCSSVDLIKESLGASKSIAIILLVTEFWKTGETVSTNLVLFAARTQARLAKTIDHGKTSLQIHILFGDVIVLALEGLARCVLALALNDANADRRLDNLPQLALQQAALLLGGEVVHDCRERGGREARVGELVDDVVGDGGVGLDGFLGGFGCWGWGVGERG